MLTIRQFRSGLYRLARLLGPGGYDCSYSYDGLGRLTGKTDNASVQERWAYDDLAREIEIASEELPDVLGVPAFGH